MTSTNLSNSGFLDVEYLHERGKANVEQLIFRLKFVYVSL